MEFRRVLFRSRMSADVAGHDCAGAQHGIAADRDAADDGGVGADGGAPLHQGRQELVLALDEGPGGQHIGEDAARPAEYVVLDRHSGIDRDVVLDLDAVADKDVRADHDVLTEHAAGAAPAAAQDVAERPDLARKSVEWGKNVAERVDTGGQRMLKKKKKKK